MIALWILALTVSAGMMMPMANAVVPPSAAPEGWACAVPEVAIEGDPIITRQEHTEATARAFAIALAQVIDLPSEAVTAAAIGELRSGFVVIVLTHPDGTCTSILLNQQLWQSLLYRLPQS